MKHGSEEADSEYQYVERKKLLPHFISVVQQKKKKVLNKKGLAYLLPSRTLRHLKKGGRGGEWEEEKAEGTQMLLPYLNNASFLLTLGIF